MSAGSLHEVFAARGPVVQSWIPAENNPVEILVPDQTQRDQVLHDTQVTWSFNSHLGKFYESFLCSGWQSAVSALSGDEALSVYPPLFTKQGKKTANCSRRRCPISEIYDLNGIQFPEQLNG
jgi:hypothetical protein